MDETQLSYLAPPICLSMLKSVKKQQSGEKTGKVAVEGKKLRDGEVVTVRHRCR